MTKVLDCCPIPMMSLPSAGPIWEVGMAKTLRLLSDSKDEPAYRWPSMGGLEARNRDRNVFDEEELVRGGVWGGCLQKKDHSTWMPYPNLRLVGWRHESELAFVPTQRKNFLSNKCFLARGPRSITIAIDMKSTCHTISNMHTLGLYTRECKSPCSPIFQHSRSDPPTSDLEGSD